jgi:hypothetical protein
MTSYIANLRGCPWLCENAKIRKATRMIFLGKGKFRRPTQQSAKAAMKADFELVGDVPLATWTVVR